MNFIILLENFFFCITPNFFMVDIVFSNGFLKYTIKSVIKIHICKYKNNTKLFAY